MAKKHEDLQQVRDLDRFIAILFCDAIGKLVQGLCRIVGDQVDLCMTKRDHQNQAAWLLVMVNSGTYGGGGIWRHVSGHILSRKSRFESLLSFIFTSWFKGASSAGGL